ncbi:rhodanese-like domain-containing protein [Methylotuvimicrobium sp. KM1]|uniref:rhodanese-like domain-containing protein n=1 Tax=Methylotuvimicrobium sp. KM1 TaxID=3377707 RepID=UPI00384F9FC9
MNKLLFLFLLMIHTQLLSASELEAIDIPQMLDMKTKQNALIIDIRTEKEWAETGTIPHSVRLQFFDDRGRYDAEQWLSEMEKLRTSPNQPVVLVCRSGNRSEKAGNLLTQKLGLGNINHLQNGIQTWIQAGYATTQHCPGLLACKQ